MHKAQSSSPTLTPEKPAEDYQSVIWALRLALTIPETMNTQSRRSGTEGILQLVGPWVHWPDALIALWDGKSKGTQHMIKTARERSLMIYIHGVE